MVRDDGYVKVLDFGLARWEGEQGVTRATQTASGAILGTLRYMSPEQARGERVSIPSDIFSLGIVLYELFTGKHPFEKGAKAAVRPAAIAYRKASMTELLRVFGG